MYFILFLTITCTNVLITKFVEKQYYVTRCQLVVVLYCKKKGFVHKLFTLKVNLIWKMIIFQLVMILWRAWCILTDLSNIEE
jgi:hypothetical protein